MTDPATLTVAFMGPQGTFSDIAARIAFPGAATLETPTIPAVFETVERGAANVGVVPIENSTEGGVSATLTALLESSLSICGELVIPVRLCLVARHQDRSLIRSVHSHPQPLAQCRHWLARELPGAPLVSTLSTATAALDAKGQDAIGAITSHLGAELHELYILAEDIQDSAENATRFVIVGPNDASRTGRDKTSIVFTTAHQQGALHQALGVFDAAGINLTRIESRPAPGKRWEYVFVTDLEGHRTDPAVAGALDALRQRSSTVRVLGSYPRARNAED